MRKLSAPLIISLVNTGIGLGYLLNFRVAKKLGECNIHILWLAFLLLVTKHKRGDMAVQINI